MTNRRGISYSLFGEPMDRKTVMDTGVKVMNPSIVETGYVDYHGASVPDRDLESPKPAVLFSTAPNASQIETHSDNRFVAFRVCCGDLADKLCWSLR